MSLPARYLAQKLADPLPTTDGGMLRTIGEAVVFTRQLSLALFMDAKLDVGHKRDATPRRAAR